MTIEATRGLPGRARRGEPVRNPRVAGAPPRASARLPFRLPSCGIRGYRTPSGRVSSCCVAERRPGDARPRDERARRTDL